MNLQCSYFLNLFFIINIIIDNKVTNVRITNKIIILLLGIELPFLNYILIHYYHVVVTTPEWLTVTFSVIVPLKSDTPYASKSEHFALPVTRAGEDAEEVALPIVTEELFILTTNAYTNKSPAFEIVQPPLELFDKSKVNDIPKAP